MNCSGKISAVFKITLPQAHEIVKLIACGKFYITEYYAII